MLDKTTWKPKIGEAVKMPLGVFKYRDEPDVSVWYACIGEMLYDADAEMHKHIGKKLGTFDCVREGWFGITEEEKKEQKYLMTAKLTAYRQGGDSNDATEVEFVVTKEIL